MGKRQLLQHHQPASPAEEVPLEQHLQQQLAAQHQSPQLTQHGEIQHSDDAVWKLVLRERHEELDQAMVAKLRCVSNTMSAVVLEACGDKMRTLNMRTKLLCRPVVADSVRYTLWCRQAEAEGTAFSKWLAKHGRLLKELKLSIWPEQEETIAQALEQAAAGTLGYTGAAAAEAEAAAEAAAATGQAPYAAGMQAVQPAAAVNWSLDAAARAVLLAAYAPTDLASRAALEAALGGPLQPCHAGTPYGAAWTHMAAPPAAAGGPPMLPAAAAAALAPPASGVLPGLPMQQQPQQQDEPWQLQLQSLILLRPMHHKCVFLGCVSHTSLTSLHLNVRHSRDLQEQHFATAMGAMVALRNLSLGVLPGNSYEPCSSCADIPFLLKMSLTSLQLNRVQLASKTLAHLSPSLQHLGFNTWGLPGRYPLKLRHLENVKRVTTSELRWCDELPPSLESLTVDHMAAPHLLFTLRNLQHLDITRSTLEPGELQQLAAAELPLKDVGLWVDDASKLDSAAFAALHMLPLKKLHVVSGSLAPAVVSSLGMCTHLTSLCLADVTVKASPEAFAQNLKLCCEGSALCSLSLQHVVFVVPAGSSVVGSNDPVELMQPLSAYLRSSSFLSRCSSVDVAGLSVEVEGVEPKRARLGDAEVVPEQPEWDPLA